uniref:Cytosolic arginine sensor for mTORC1 subunit 1 n=1 Tax=Accipiter nisus TaxID=211598 RepID=A0A8B9NTS0_9AVES
MDLHILEHRVRVLSLARRGLWLYTHPLLKLLFLPQRCRCKFFSLTETPEDYTIMLDEEGFKELPPSEFMQVADSTWLVLSVVSNGREPSGCQATGVTKIARSVIAPLAEHHVSVLMLSTYQTDFILVRERDLPVVIHTLAGEFDIYKEESGERVPVTCDDVSNGFLKPKPGERYRVPPGPPASLRDAPAPTGGTRILGGPPRATPLHPERWWAVAVVATGWHCGTVPKLSPRLTGGSPPFASRHPHAAPRAEPPDPLLRPDRGPRHAARHRHHAHRRPLLLPQPPEGGWRRQPGPRLHHLLRLLPHRGLHLHRDGCRNAEAVGTIPGTVCLSVCPSPGLGAQGQRGLHAGPPSLRFPSDLLLTSSTGELWRMVRIGGQPLGFGEFGRRGHVPPAVPPPPILPLLGGECFWGDALPVYPRGSATGATAHPGRSPFPSPDECGIVAQIAEPLAAADISAYYISTFNFDHALVSP